MKKSKKQKTWCFILEGTGLGVFTVGLFMAIEAFEYDITGGTVYNEKPSRMGGALMYIGGGLVLISVPLKIAYK